MIPALIYSKNRAAQLDLLLRSIDRFAPWIEPWVLWVCDSTHVESYQVLRRERKKDHLFWFETSLEGQTREWLRFQDRFMWLVDDAVFFQKAKEPSACPWSCRTTGSYRWRDFEPQTERGYPMALVGTVYERDSVLPLLDFEFDNPNTLERGLDARRDRFTPEIMYGEGQSLVTIENNAVSILSANPTMGGDVDELRDRFMNGERISLDRLDFSNVNNKAHIQVEYEWD